MKIDTQPKVAPFHPMPFVRLELALLSVATGQLRVLFSKRAEVPEKGKWALPGGVLRIDKDASLDAAAMRVAQERLNGSFSTLKQVVAVGRAEVDPRAPWTLSVLYRCLVRPDIELVPGKRVAVLQWHALDTLPVGDVAFDHEALIAQAVESVRADVRALRLGSGWLPAEFTIPELQSYCEVVLGEKLDKVTFRRRLDAAAVIDAIEGRTRIVGAHRPAQVYQLAST